MESTALSSPRRWLQRYGGGLAATIALVLYGLMLVRHVDACAGGSDSSGYMNHARLLGSGHLHSPPRALPGLDASHFSDFVYTPLGFVPKDGSLVPTYPVGLPLLILGAEPFTGWNHAGDAVIVFHALAGLVLIFIFGRVLGFRTKWCVLAAVVLGASPLYLGFSLQAMSDVPAMAWTTGAALAAWLGRRKLGWTAAAGCIFSIAVLIRPNNALMVAPIAVAWWPEAWNRGELRRMLVRIGLFGAGGLPAAIGFVAHSHAAYGHWLATGYGDAGGLFMTSVVPETLRHYARWMPVVFTPGIWLFAALPAVAWRDRTAAFLLAWGLVYLGFYVSYFHTHEVWWYLRFILPAAPALIFGALWIARGLWQWACRLAPVPPACAYVGCALALAGALKAELRWDREFQVLAVGQGEANYPKVMTWLREHAPANSVLTVMQASGAAFYYTDFIFVRWDQMTPRLFPEVVAAAARAGRPIYAPLFPFETESALQERMPGRWDRAGNVADIIIWRWAGAASAR